MIGCISTLFENTKASVFPGAAGQGRTLRLRGCRHHPYGPGRPGAETKSAGTG